MVEVFNLFNVTNILGVNVQNYCWRSLRIQHASSQGRRRDLGERHGRVQKARTEKRPDPTHTSHENPCGAPARQEEPLVQPPSIAVSARRDNDAKALVERRHCYDAVSHWQFTVDVLFSACLSIVAMACSGARQPEILAAKRCERPALTKAIATLVEASREWSPAAQEQLGAGTTERWCRRRPHQTRAPRQYGLQC